MSMRSDHKALLFLGGIALLGATVRAARAIGAPRVTQPALERQMQAADSAKQTQSAKRRQPRKQSSPKSTAERSASRSAAATALPADASHRDYRGRLDLDVATAAEIDVLPGVGPALAKRIVVDRMTNGPFRELVALRRVKGVSLKLLASLDSLAAFSGVYKPVSAADTILPNRASRRRR